MTGAQQFRPERSDIDEPRRANEPARADNATSRGRPRTWGGFFAAVLRVSLKTLLPIAVIAGGVLGYRLLIATKPPPPVRDKQEFAFTVDTMALAAGTYQPTLSLYGSTVAGRQVDIRALVSGKVIETGDNLREGGNVAEGDLILTIDPIDYRTGLSELKAQLKETRARIAEFEGSLATGRQSLIYAKNQAELARTDLARAEPLARRGTVSERTVDDRRQVLLQRQQAADELENNLKVWQARVDQQTAAATRLETAIERAERRLAETVLTAPFDAFVSDVGAQVGRVVGTNDKVATLIDRNWIEAKFNLTDDQFGRIVANDGAIAGRKVTVRWVLGDNVFEYPATIERIGARISSATGGVEVFARIENASEPVALRPGAFVEVAVPDTTYRNVFRVPATAVYNGDTIFAVVGERLEARKVRIVGGLGEDLLVDGAVKDGDVVMTTRISTPGTGVKVKQPKTEAAAG